jgi:hypothetical protein
MPVFRLRLKSPRLSFFENASELSLSDAIAESRSQKELSLETSAHQSENDIATNLLTGNSDQGFVRWCRGFHFCCWYMYAALNSSSSDFAVGCS